MTEQEAYDKGYKQGYADRIEMEKALRSDDCISRQAVINEIANTNFWLSASNWEELMKAINDTPSVKPTSVNGKWIPNEDEKGKGVKCSLCGYATHNKLHYLYECAFNYCPNCGADMRDMRGEEDADSN